MNKNEKEIKKVRKRTLWNCMYKYGSKNEVPMHYEITVFIVFLR